MRSEEEMIAYALETDPALLPFMPELLADLEELGSDAEYITQAIGEIGLPHHTNLIDLGCGKGAVAVAIAEDLGFTVVGIDLFAPFIESCNETARLRGVADKCTFIQGDILKLAGKIEPADVIVFAALGDVLGPLNETMAVLRQYVKPEGYIVISDAFVKEGGSSDFPGFEQYTDHDETVSRLTACGDRLVREIAMSDAPAGNNQDGDHEDHEESVLITARAEAIAARHPELAQAVRAYAKNQAAEYDYIDANLVDTIWVLQRR